MTQDADQRKKDELERKKGKVRVRVTYIATGYIFGGLLLLIHGATTGMVQDPFFGRVKDLYMVGVPIASGVIAFWFGDRSRGKKPE